MLLANTLQYKRGVKMLGIEDPYIWSAYVLCIISAIACMAYGIAKWNEEEEEDCL
jgi:hypothetical protein